VPAGLEPGVIVINVPQRMLFYDAGTQLAGLPVAVGRPDWPTPLRAFTVIARETDPTWDVPASIRAEALARGTTLPAVVPPGPNNPLGRYWLGLSVGGVGIHGTNAPASIYRVTTHGCIRLSPDNIAWLFERVAVGAPGRTIYEPILLGEVGGAIYVEVHRDIYRRLDILPAMHLRKLAAATGLLDRIDWVTAGQAVAAAHGVARRIDRAVAGQIR
jgi:L,D-transpeptidase ErfK/SrfK